MSRVRLRLSPLAVWAAVFILSLPAVTLRLYASDEIEYFAYLRSLWFDHDLSFDNEYRYFYDHGIARGATPRENGDGNYGGGFHETFLEATTPTGLRINFAPIGTAILWAPFYGVADVGVRVARAFGSNIAADGYSAPYIASVAYGSAVYGFLAIALSAIAVRRILGTANWTLAAVWLGTPLVFYMYVAPGFSHACSAFAVAALFVIWLHVRTEWSWAGVIALGAATGVAGMVREQDLFIAIAPALDYVVSAIRSARAGSRPVWRSLAGALAGVLAFAVCFLPQLMAYIILYGRLGPSPLVAEKMTWTSPHAWELLTSVEHGLVFWTPLVVLAFAGLVQLSLGRVDRAASASRPQADNRWIGCLCLVMVASQVYVSGSLSSWSGSAFGQRRLIGLTVVLAVGLASLFRSVPPGWVRRTLIAAVVLCTWWNLGLAAQFGSGLMTRQRLDLSRNAYNNFVTIPRMLPSLAYRYTFDRTSFYHARPARPDPTDDDAR